MPLQQPCGSLVADESLPSSIAFTSSDTPNLSHESVLDGQSPTMIRLHAYRRQFCPTSWSRGARPRLRDRITHTPPSQPARTREPDQVAVGRPKHLMHLGCAKSIFDNAQEMRPLTQSGPGFADRRHRDPRARHHTILAQARRSKFPQPAHPVMLRLVKGRRC